VIVRKIVALEHISLDGVIQAPGGLEEDTSGGFAHGTISATFKVTESAATPSDILSVRYERAGTVENL